MKKTITNFKVSEVPIDFMLSGLFAGALRRYSKKDLYCVELMCAAQKDIQQCTFIIGPENKIYGYIKEFAPKELKKAEKFISEVKNIENTFRE